MRSAVPRSGLRRAVVDGVYGRPRASLAAVLAPPLGWISVVFLGSLALLLVTALFTLDSASQVVREPSLKNLETLLSQPVYRTITLRTVAMAALVTLTCAILAFPIAFFMARVASPRTRRWLVVLTLIPLWSSYIVKVFAWRVILQPNGPLDWVGQLFGSGVLRLGFSDVSGWIVFTYLWLPWMILPVFTSLERVPRSVLEAAADLGARPWLTFRTVILPLAFPGVVAGSIFTFSLTLGDYATPPLVMDSKFIGNVIYDAQGVAGNIPLAAAFSLVPIAIMGVYLLVARRVGRTELA